MPSRFSLQKPYVIASLPRPIDHSKGRYVIGEVFGGVPGTKRRKRSELAVGIDGEGVNLYDISSSRLITSYALPPQSYFTCPPTSMRIRTSKSQVERRTYVSTNGPQAQISLFLELTEGSAPTTTSTKTQNVEQSQRPIVYLGVIAATYSVGVSDHSFDLLAVKADGEIQCYDGDSLKAKWTSPAKALMRESTTSVNDTQVEFAHLTTAQSTSQGILKGRQDVLDLYSQGVTEDGFGPEILILVTKSIVTPTSRTLHIVSLPRRHSTQGTNPRHSVDYLLTAALPSKIATNNLAEDTSFSIQVSTGTLQQLHNGVLTTFDMSDTIPKEQSSIVCNGAKSFLRLSNTSILVSSDHFISVYNPRYQSKIAEIGLDIELGNESLKRKRDSRFEGNDVSNQSCKFISYFPRLGAAVAIEDNNLIGMQVEGQPDTHGRVHTSGLLIDSIGCSIRSQEEAELDGREAKKSRPLNSVTLEHFLPYSIGDLAWEKQKAQIERNFSSENVAEFDSFMAPLLGIDVSKVNDAEMSKELGFSMANGEPPHGTQQSTKIDRRWVSLALSKIFTWSPTDDDRYQLSISFYPPSTFMWLAKNGYMTVANIESAIKKDGPVTILDGQLVNALVELEPSMELLLAVLSNNYLEAGELLHAIRKLMDSLGLLGENPNTKQELLTNGDVEPTNGDIDERLEQLEEEVAHDLDLAEYQLGDGSRIRADSLSLALSKLYRCPSHSIVLALQSTFTSQEVVCLIYLLRFELARGAWTARYTDDQGDEGELIDVDGDVADNAVMLISSLLNNCIDAVGAGGWLSGEARLVDGDPFEAEELIASLKLEVSAALEGIEEAVYLRGLTSEMIRYGDTVQEALPKPEADKKRKPVILPPADKEFKILPLGLKAEKQISLLKMDVGGAIYRRSRRDIGYLKSQKVGKYSREKISI